MSIAAVRGIGVAVITSTSGDVALRRAAGRAARRRTGAARRSPRRRGRRTRRRRRCSACVPTRMSTVAAAQALGDAAPLGRGRAVGEQRDAAPAARRAASPRSTTDSSSSSARDRELVLLGEHLGRRHERALVPALHRHEQRGERDDGLARTRRRPAAAGASAPGCAMSSVISRDRGGLVAGERERQRGVERGHERAVDRVHDAGRLRRRARACGRPARPACAGTRRT